MFFDEVITSLPDLQDGTAAWADYDRDGDLDLALTGDTGSGLVTEIYRNTAGAFAPIGAGLTGLKNAALDWTDYDADGAFDLLVSGEDGGGSPVTKLYRQDGSSFVEVPAGLISLRHSAADRQSVDVNVDWRQEDADLPPILGWKVANGWRSGYQDTAVGGRQHSPGRLGHHSVRVAEEKQKDAGQSQKRKADDRIEGERADDAQRDGGADERPTRGIDPHKRNTTSTHKAQGTKHKSQRTVFCL